MAKKVKCLVCPRKTDEPRRGMCEACYRAAKARVSAGEVTWPELVAVGLAGPPGKRGRKSQWEQKADAILSKKRK